MRDITIELSLRGRIRYVAVRAFVSLCVAAAFAMLLLTLVDDSLKVLRGERIPPIDIFWESVGLPFCSVFFWAMTYKWCRRYPVFRSSQLEIHWGTVRLLGRNGEILAEIKRATAARESDGNVWFRNRSKASDAFDFPVYLVAGSRRGEFLAALDSAKTGGSKRQ